MSDNNSRNFSFAFFVARRYLFSKKSHNVINIISAISATGVAVVTAALICVMSVFNGFENLVGTLYSAFDPDLKITPAKGKHFDMNNPQIQKVIHFNEIKNYSTTIQDNALLRYGDKQMPVIVKGVSDNFEEMTRIDSIMYDGKFYFSDGAFDYAVVGFGVAGILGINPYFFTPLEIYAPKRSERINILRPDKSLTDVKTFVSGIFFVQQAQYDENYVLVSLDMARSLFEMDSTTVSAIELQFQPNVNANKVHKLISNTLGNNFVVQNRMEQQESFFKILNMERWFAFAILCFILLISSFNLFGSLSMLIIEKKEDTQTLKSMGADNTLVQYIFLFEGWLISFLGLIIGIVAGILLCLAQQHLGLIHLGENYIINSLPVSLQIKDLFFIFSMVIIIGFTISFFTAKFAKNSNKKI
ncbi:MAG: FtsX-like permease family protein [Paludibacter sp.]|nr:FtsX-like permease family protein [Paludibacter sp.]